ncbi:hypothetical protein H2201_002765 [Coniosporium apollinis]|uniref:Phytase A n=1 Tax=Coniosporium apollinis TaxID=61459 RepID=A0ABQ9NXY5_9PEZI|nr:hypothetical protein H2201_002765 [Coniosporium apollinis]
MTHHWGQYSSYFSVPSDISDEIPHGCRITFAQVLSRHGARDPTTYKTVLYKTLVDKIQKSVKSFKGKYSFLNDYKYNLGAEELSAFGQQQMFNSGAKFYNRYGALAGQNPLFIRTTGSHRVIMSAENFTQGFHEMMRHDKDASRKGDYPYIPVVLDKREGANVTLSHDLCDAYKHRDRSISDEARETWASVFIPPIWTRLHRDLPGLDSISLELSDIVLLMDLCPFETAASRTGAISPFCYLFSEQEWQQYSYFKSVNTYYAFSHGTPLGPTQGVGWVNELIARMTASPVKDATSVNHTLDDDMATFPIGKGHVLFADFGHDNGMTTIFSAMGLYNDTKPLAFDHLDSAETNGGYSAAWTVPFAARMYVEKMQCAGEKEELVRAIVNDRVQPLKQCGRDQLGRCTLDAFVRSLEFARTGGKWAECFA